MQTVLNRGTDEGIAVGDVVSTGFGELVGTVERVSADHSIVRMVGDPTLEVTARVLTSDVAGLVRSDRGSSVVLDLVRNDEVVAEGATLVTSGDDRYPAGLIIGTVRSIDHEAVTLFQRIRVTPAVRDDIHGPVLVSRP